VRGFSGGGGGGSGGGGSSCRQQQQQQEEKSSMHAAWHGTACFSSERCIEYRNYIAKSLY
jgi:hypothetical protein